LCSCENGRDCCSTGPIHIDTSKGRLSFNPQGGIDTVFVLDDTYWWFWDEKEEFKGCTFIEYEKIECSWFSTVKKDDSTIIVSVKQNDTEEARSQSIYIKDSSYTGSFTITQCFESTDELSKEEFLFSADGGVDSVTVTKNIGHWLSLSGSGIPGGPPTAAHHFNPPYIVEGSWYTISIPDEKKVIFSIKKNETGKERDFTATLSPVYICEDSRVKIIQSAE